MQADLSVLQFEFQWNGATTKEHTAIRPRRITLGALNVKDYGALAPEA